MVAAAAAGPRRIQAGSVRDSAIGVRFVDGSGTIVKNGGRVMKNVTGYDLVKLMCGSFGTLGVLSEITFKVLPKPQTAATVVLAGLSVERAVAALSVAMTSQFDVNGAAHYGVGEAARSLIRVEGFEASTAYRAGQLKSLLASFGDAEIITAGSEVGRIWRLVRDVEPFKAREGAIWKVSLRPSRAPAFVAAIAALQDTEYVLDWGGGLAWVLVPQAADDGASTIRGAVTRLGGHATLMRSSGLAGTIVSAFQPQSEPVARLSQDLRRQFDPLSDFNPGRMIPASAVWGG
jgi:glycolate oxidase FAD binding subunit